MAIRAPDGANKYKDRPTPPQMLYFQKIKFKGLPNLFVSSVRSSNSHLDLLVIQQQHPLFQIIPVLKTGLSLSEPLQLHKGHNAI